MITLILQFVLEVARALLIDELSGHVRKRIIRWYLMRRSGDRCRAIVTAHQRSRKKLLHRLATEMKGDQ